MIIFHVVVATWLILQFFAIDHMADAKDIFFVLFMIGRFRQNIVAEMIGDTAGFLIDHKIYKMTRNGTSDRFFRDIR